MSPNRREVIGREEEMRVLSEAIKRAGEPRDHLGAGPRLLLLVGPPGIGKRTLLRELSGDADFPEYRDGSCVLPKLPEDGVREDVLQAIWDEFIESDGSVWPSQRRDHLISIRALILLPAADTFIGSIAELLDAMPNAVFCASVSEESSLEGLTVEHERIRVGELSYLEMLTVFRSVYLDPVPASARSDIISLCLSAGETGKIELLAREAERDERRTRGQSLVQWAAEMNGRDPDESSYIFISYSRKDTAYADRLAEHLWRAGVPVWIDRVGIDADDDFPPLLVSAIKECAAMIVVMSPNARESEWVSHEIAVAAQNRTEIFPLLLAGSGLPQLGHLSAVDVLDEELPDRDFLVRLRLLAGLGPELDDPVSLLAGGPMPLLDDPLSVVQHFGRDASSATSGLLIEG